MKINAPRIAYISLISVYLLAPLIHDVIPGYPDLKTNDWVALLGIYALGCIAALPMLFQFIKSGDRKTKHVKFFYFRWAFCLLIQITSIISFWNNSLALYVSLPLVILLSAFIMSFHKAVKLANARVYRDDESGSLYFVGPDFTRKLSKDESAAFRNKVLDVDIPLFSLGVSGLTHEFGSPVEDMIINPSSGLPMVNGFGGVDVGGNTWGNDNLHSGFSVNPTSGLPMDGINTGIDMDGNSWGTTSSGFSGMNSPFDSDRGY
ncbi:hypothetical protein [Kluyvera sichuanensis]|uniref:hypothetical protein n=1 Tax=Kluyvera sichuanensis TaxID=2725494 RepID=UPI0034A51ECE